MNILLLEMGADSAKPHTEQTQIEHVFFVKVFDLIAVFLSTEISNINQFFSNFF